MTLTELLPMVRQLSAPDKLNRLAGNLGNQPAMPLAVS